MRRYVGHMSSSHQDPTTSADAHELDASHDDAGPAGGAGPDLEAAAEDAQSPPTPGHVDVDLDEHQAGATASAAAAHATSHDVAAHAVAASGAHDAHDAEPVESGAWVLAPLLVGLVIAVVVVLWLGLGSSA